MLKNLALDLEDHIRRETEDNIERGIEPEEARYAALRKFGNVTRAREDTRDIWSFIWLEQAFQDIRYTVRTLRRNSGFTAVAVLTLALGTGMNTAVFSVVNAVLLQSLPYPNPERMVWVSHTCGSLTVDCFIARADYRVYREQAHSFDSLTAVGNEDLAVVFHGEASTERVSSIEGDFWSLTNAKPILGRLFGENEPDQIVLTFALFERRFGNDPSVIGKKVTIEGHAFTIAGVLSPSFRHLFPQALYTGDEIREIDAYIPVPVGHEIPGSVMRHDPVLGPAPPWFRIIGRLRPGTKFEQAHAEIQVIFDRINREYPDLYTHTSRQQGLRFETLTERLTGRVRPTLFILLGAVAFVLLIAVANVASLLLARASTREREITIRVAVGAGRMRVIRQLLSESGLLGLFGGTAGSHWHRCLFGRSSVLERVLFRGWMSRALTRPYCFSRWQFRW